MVYWPRSRRSDWTSSSSAASVRSEHHQAWVISSVVQARPTWRVSNWAARSARGALAGTRGNAIQGDQLSSQWRTTIASTSVCFVRAARIGLGRPALSDVASRGSLGIAQTQGSATNVVVRVWPAQTAREQSDVVAEDLPSLPIDLSWSQSLEQRHAFVDHRRAMLPSRGVGKGVHSCLPSLGAAGDLSV